MSENVKNYDLRTTRIFLTIPKTLKDLHKEHHQAVLPIIKSGFVYTGKFL